MSMKDGGGGGGEGEGGREIGIRGSEIRVKKKVDGFERGVVTCDSRDS